MKKIIVNIKTLLASKSIFAAIILLWILLQVVWIILYKTDVWYTDYGLYQYYAQICAEHGTMYPNMSFYNNEYIFAPGWVNILILWYKVFGSFTHVPFLQMFFNIVAFASTVLICKKCPSANKDTLVHLAGYLYMIMPAFFTSNVIVCSEISYVAFATFSILLSLKIKKKQYLFISGVLIAVALWIRPLALAWIIATIVCVYLRGKTLKPCMVYLIGVLITCASIGMCTHQNFPDYLYKASTGGVNLIMGANDFAHGGYCFEARAEGGLGHLEGLRDPENNMTPVRKYLDSEEYIAGYSKRYTYTECDSIYKARSIEWIINNPVRWLSTIPHKVKLMYFSGTQLGVAKADNSYKSYRAEAWLSLWQRIYIEMLFVVCLMGLLLIPLYKNLIFTTCVIVIFIVSAMTIACVVIPRYNYILLNLMMLMSLFVSQQTLVLIDKCCPVVIGNRK